MGERQRETVFLEFNRWMFDSRGLSMTTRKNYANTIRRCDTWLRANRDSSAAWATEKDLQAYLFQSRPAASTRNNIRSALRCFGDFLVDAGWRKDNPGAKLPRLPVRRPVPKALDVEQAHRIIKHAENFELQSYVMISVFLYCGLRHDEARHLEWHHISDDFRWLNITGKGNKNRQVPVHPVAASALRRWKGLCLDPRWVFPSPRNNGEPIGQSSLAGVVKMIGDAAGVEGLHPHVLRHTVATRMLERTGDLRAVQEFLGHESPATTVIYTKVRPAKLQEASETLDF